MSEQLSVREARAEDAETILGFIRDLATYEREPGAVENTAENLRAQMQMARPPFECLIAERGEEAVGFALFFPTYSTWTGRPGLWLEDLWVAPSARRGGVARALMAGLARIAEERGYARIDWSVLRWNRLALDFYRTLGASPLTEWLGQRLDREGIARLARG